MDETNSWGADTAIERSGAAVAMEQAIDCVVGKNENASGNVVSVGLQTDPMEEEYWGLREGKLTVSGNYTRSEFQEILELLESGEVALAESVSHTLPLERIHDGIGIVRNDENTVRVVLTMNGGGE